MKDFNLYIFDIETTDADISTCKMLESAILHVRNQEIIDKFYLRSNIPVPSKHVSRGHIPIPTIIPEHIVIKRTKEYLSTKAYPIVGWGLFFEYNFMKKHKYTLSNPKRDLMLIMRRKLNLKQNPSFDSIRQKYKISTDIAEPHTALGDVHLIYEFLKLLWKKG